MKRLDALHVLCVGIPLGIIVGAAIALYDYIVNTLLWANFTHRFSPLELSSLPLLGMLLTGMILRLFRVTTPAMADEVVQAYHDPDYKIPAKTLLPKLAASAATMGFGASAGMEGASKWLGANIGSLMQSFLNRCRIPLLQGRIETLMLAGGAAGIGAIFRAPLTGAIMGVESPFRKGIANEALLHALVASASSYATFILLRPNTPYFPIQFHYVLNYRDLGFAMILGVLAGLSSHLFLNILYAIKNASNRCVKYSLVPYLLGGLAVSGIACLCVLLVGDPATLHAGLPVANRLLNGQYVLWMCLFLFFAKLLATAFTFGTGGVGGLFVPSATIGAALGAACDILFVPSQPGVFTVIGIAAFTAASYNNLLFSVVFIAEATASPALLVPGLLASCTAYMISSGFSNSPSQSPCPAPGREKQRST